MASSGDVGATNENVQPGLEPPPLLRQTTLTPDQFGPFNNGVVVNGQFIPPIFQPLPNGLWGYDVEDVENIIRNNGWYEEESDSDGEYELEMIDSDSDSEPEELNNTCVGDLPPLESIPPQ